MSTRERTPADDVATKLAEFVDREAADALGSGYRLAGLDWADDPSNDDGMYPWIVVDAQGRRFEVEIEVMVREASDAA